MLSLLLYILGINRKFPRNCYIRLDSSNQLFIQIRNIVLQYNENKAIKPKLRHNKNSNKLFDLQKYSYMT